jgi:WXG100 family type VII secretion target
VVGEQKVALSEIRRAAEEFASAGRDSQTIIKRLEEAVAELETGWSGVTQEMFYHHYTEWRNLMQGHVALLLHIAQEMHAIAERYEGADT